jgi:pyrroline-5-carboxylate reductase
MAQLRIGFIGAGRMATALAAGFVASGLVRAEDLAASDPSPTAGQEFGRRSGGKVLGGNRAVASQSEVLFLAVKPQHMAEAAESIRGVVAGRLVVSIAAGVPMAALGKGLGEGARLIRVMPNTPCLVGQGASGYCLGPGATEADGALVGRLLGAVGRAYQVPERLLDAVTGLSGSGPAFVYLVIEALSDGGVRAGLPRDVATALAAQTVKGAAEMVLATGEHPGSLKDQVASPGGTTIAGLATLEQRAVRGALIDAVVAAATRSHELGRAT